MMTIDDGLSFDIIFRSRFLFVVVVVVVVWFVRSQIRSTGALYAQQIFSIRLAPYKIKLKYVYVVIAIRILY